MKHQGWVRYAMLFARGLAMGAADVVPGVSGGTIAFITGIYEELIDSLRRIDHRALGCLFSQGPVAAWQHINGNFLLAVFGGVACSLLSLARLITYCLDNFPILVWSFFFGLILASIIHLVRGISLRKPQVIALFLLGAALALSLSFARPAAFPDTWWMLFLAGAVAICAMILPGISGSFILLLMGMYSVFLQALAEFNLVKLASFLVGCACGLLLFSHFLGWLLRKWHELTLALLSGFLLGSLNIIWPWKHVVSTRLDRHGDTVPFIQENVSPQGFELLSGDDSQWLAAISFMFVGLFVVLIIEWFFSPPHSSQEIDSD